MEDVMLKFKAKELCPFMTKDDIRKTAPFVFAKDKTNPNVSERYAFSSTERLIDDMAKLGWGVTECKQQRPNKRTNVRSFHTVAFQNPEVFLTNEQGEIDAFPRIIVSTSHDGFHSFKFMAGIYRLICSNGLIVCDNEFTSFKLRHINYSYDELMRIVAQSIELTKQKVAVINDMQEKNLTIEQKRELARRAIAIRKGVKEWDELKVDNQDIDGILEPVRKEDEGDSLWNVFNVLQEKVITGDFTLGKTKTGKNRKARPITGAAKDIDVNQSLFLTATEYLQAA
jgi:hypothetical protein